MSIHYKGQRDSQIRIKPETVRALKLFAIFPSVLNAQNIYSIPVSDINQIPVYPVHRRLFEYPVVSIFEGLVQNLSRQYKYYIFCAKEMLTS